MRAPGTTSSTSRTSSRPRSSARILRNTIIISLLHIGFGFPAPILLALLINEIVNNRFKRVVQSISYLPHFMSWVILAGIIVEILSPQRGIVAHVATLLGLEPRNVLTDRSLFRPMLVATGIWKEVGWGTVIYLAALSSINPELYESAAVDGAGRIPVALRITVPSLIPVMTILVILRLGELLNAGFDQIFNLYNPLVYEVADIIDTYVYRVGPDPAAVRLRSRGGSVQERDRRSPHRRLQRGHPAVQRLRTLVGGTMRRPWYARRRSAGDVAFSVFNTLFLVLFCLTILYPFWTTLLLSFSPPDEVLSLGFRIWIDEWATTAYRFAFSEYGNVITAYANSVYRTVVGTVLTVLFTMIAAYPLAKKNLPGRTALTVVVLITMFFSGGLIPLYLVVRSLGLIDSRWSLILAGPHRRFLHHHHAQLLHDGRHVVRRGGVHGWRELSPDPLPHHRAAVEAGDSHDSALARGLALERVAVRAHLPQ